jgi:hypothetical protein
MSDEDDDTEMARINLLAAMFFELGERALNGGRYIVLFWDDDGGAENITDPPFVVGNYTPDAFTPDLVKTLRRCADLLEATRHNHEVTVGGRSVPE